MAAIAIATALQVAVLVVTSTALYALLVFATALQQRTPTTASYAVTHALVTVVARPFGQATLVGTTAC